MVVSEVKTTFRTVSPDALREWMEFRDITVRQLADKTGCSRTAIGYLRTGERRTVSPRNAAKIAKALDVPVNKVFTDRASTVQRDVPPGRVA